MAETYTTNDLILFSKEIGRHPYLYRLYFAELSTLTDKTPVIRRFVVKSRAAFDGYALGGVYSLTHDGLIVLSAEHEGDAPLSETDYLTLVDVRDLRFMDDHTSEEIGLTNEDYSPAERYYSYQEISALLNYQPSTKHRLLYAFLKVASYAACIIVPLGLWLLFTYTISVLMQDAGLNNTPFGLPILTLGTMSFIIWLMCFLFKNVDLFLLNTEAFRYDSLKSYALKWGGMRKSCQMEPEERKSLAKGGYITGAVCIVSLLVALFLL